METNTWHLALKNGKIKKTLRQNNAILCRAALSVPETIAEQSS
jgi:hypothetical protein